MAQEKQQLTQDLNKIQKRLDNLDQAELYLTGGMSIPPPQPVNVDWRDAFLSKYGQPLHDLIQSNIDEWLEFREMFVFDFNQEYKPSLLSSRTFLNAIETYCKNTGLFFKRYKVVRRGGAVRRVHIFSRTKLVF